MAAKSNYESSIYGPDQSLAWNADRPNGHSGDATFYFGDLPLIHSSKLHLIPNIDRVNNPRVQVRIITKTGDGLMSILME